MPISGASINILSGSVAASGSSLASGKIIVGNSSGIATAVTPSGDVTITNAGVTAIGSAKVTNAMLAGSIAYSNLVLTGAIVNADVNASAAIAGTKISPNFGSQNVTSVGTFSGKAGNSAAASLKFGGAIVRSAPATQSNSSTTETDLFTGTCPANTMNANGDCLIYESAGGLANNGATKTLKFYFGDQSITLFSVTTANVTWHARLTMARLSATQLRVNGYAVVNTSIITPIDATITPTNALTVDQTVKVTGQGTTGTGDMNAKMFSVDYFPGA